jgi:hypothetical protein
LPNTREKHKRKKDNEKKFRVHFDSLLFPSFFFLSFLISISLKVGLEETVGSGAQ